MLRALFYSVPWMVLTATLYSGAAEAGTNLFNDGGFEAPTTPAGGYTLYSVGQRIGKWTVVGPSGGTVATVSTSYQHDGITLNAQGGLAYLNLAGSTNEATGVSQTVKLVPEKSYKLVFYTGNVKDPSGGYGTKSKILFYLNGKMQATAANTEHVAGQQLWKRYRRFEFVAETTFYTFEFINDDPSDDGSCGLDSVSLVETDK